MLNPIVDNFLNVHFVLLIAFAAFYYKAAEIDNASTVFWTGLSIVISMATWHGLRWGAAGQVFGQGLLFAGIIAWRAVRDYRNEKTTDAAGHPAARQEPGPSASTDESNRHGEGPPQ
jgi:hypothetical protein